MDDGDSAQERMEEYERLAQQEREFRAEKRTALSMVSDDLTEAVERAVEEAGTNVQVESVSGDGTQQTLTATLDRAALVAAATRELPPGFTVKQVTEDGSLLVEWAPGRTYRNSARRQFCRLSSVRNWRPTPTTSSRAHPRAGQSSSVQLNSGSTRTWPASDSSG